MNSVFLFWLALVNAFTVATASIAARGDVIGGGAGRGYESNPAQLLAVANRASEETVRVPLRVSTIVATSTAQAPTVGKGSGSPSLHRVERELYLPPTDEVLSIFGNDVHRFASRGAVLPYFGTAPPV